MNELSWEEILNMIGKEVKFNINEVGELKAIILGAEELANGQKWVSFQPENREFSPLLYGFPTGVFNSVYYPTRDRVFRGFYSDEIFSTMSRCFTCQ